MKRPSKFVRILLTGFVFVFAAYAYSVLWRPSNVRLIVERAYGAKTAVTGEKGPIPHMTYEAIAYIVEHHVDQDTYEDERKFLSSVDYVTLGDVVYQQAERCAKKEQSYIYESNRDGVVGTRGERRVRLVTTEDGTVITMYPVSEKE